MKNVIQFDRNGESGNIFWILGQARKILLSQNRIDDFDAMKERVKQGNYEQALNIIEEYGVELQDITYYKPKYQPRIYEQLMQFCRDTQTNQRSVIELLRHYTDELGWGMQASLDYVVELFENGTIQKIKALGGMR